MATKKSPAAKECGCVAKLNKMIFGSNVKITQELMLDFKKGNASMSEPSVRLSKLDEKKRGAIPVLFCTYCPFCGKKYV